MRGKLADGFMIEFLTSHTNVTYQPSFNEPWYRGINPYALGFAMYSDIRRICESPTNEDREWFPEIAGKPWRETLDHAMRNFKDEGFIQQFLSPKVMRDFRLFAVYDSPTNEHLHVTAIHNESGYRELRAQLSDRYNLSLIDSDIQIVHVDLHGDRALTLLYKPQRRRELDLHFAMATVKHVAALWTCPVVLMQEIEGGDTTELCRAKPPLVR